MNSIKDNVNELSILFKVDNIPKCVLKDEQVKTREDDKMK